MSHRYYSQVFVTVVVLDTVRVKYCMNLDEKLGSGAISTFLFALALGLPTNL